MKKYIIIPFCFVSLLNGMITQHPIPTAREWNTKDYVERNKIQEYTTKQLLKEININLTNKVTLNIGSDTGNISAFIAQPSTILIHSPVNNLLCEQCFTEKFSPYSKFDIVTLFFCLPWMNIGNKKLVLQKCYDCLKSGGELIGNISTGRERLPIGNKVLDEIFPQLQKIAPTLKNAKILQPYVENFAYYISENHLTAFLKKIGFTQISLELKFLNLTFKDINELSAFERPAMMNIPFMQSLAANIREKIFTLYINALFNTLKKDSNGYYINQDDQTTVIHCFKGSVSKL
jgi:SAM-dependent methyltransferase